MSGFEFSQPAKERIEHEGETEKQYGVLKDRIPQHRVDPADDQWGQEPKPRDQPKASGIGRVCRSFSQEPDHKERNKAEERIEVKYIPEVLQRECPRRSAKPSAHAALTELMKEDRQMRNVQQKDDAPGHQVLPAFVFGYPKKPGQPDQRGHQG